MRNYAKYTKEMLEPLVRESVSVAEVLRKLGKRQSGSISTHLSRVIKKFDIDTSHFLGQRANQGENHKGGPKKKTWEEILVLKEGDRREDAFRLRRALVESGRDYKCEKCEADVWNGEELKLEVDHKDGNWLNNRPENLRFLCPNCHSQTKGYSGSKGLTGLFAMKPNLIELRKNLQE